MTADARQEELIVGYYEGTLSDSDQQQLAQLLATSEQARRLLVAHGRLAGGLASLGTMAGLWGETRPVQHPPLRSGRSLRPLLAAAAVLALTTAGILMPRSQRPHAPAPVCAQVVLCDARMRITRGTESLVAVSGMELRSGDRVHGHGRIILDQGTDGSRLELAADGSLTELGPHTVLLEDGFINAGIAHQLPGASLRFLTPQAQAEVVGTRLSLRAMSLGTILTVTEGRVRLRAAGHELVVGAGEGAEVQGSDGPYRLPRAHDPPALPRWVPLLPPPRGHLVTVQDAQSLQRAVAQLRDGTTILLAPGTYELTQTLVISQVHDVELRGAGYESTILLGPTTTAIRVIAASKVRISALAVGDTGNTAIDLDGHGGGRDVSLYGLRIYDPGVSFIQANTDTPAFDQCHIDYCICEYTRAAALEPYRCGIGTAGGSAWTIEHSLFRRLPFAAGGSYQIPPAIWVSQGSRQTVIGSNAFIDCARAVACGSRERPGHEAVGGSIHDNYVWHGADGLRCDVAIGLWDAPGIDVVHNTIMLHGRYPNAIEFRFPGTSGGLIAANLTDSWIGPRDGGTATVRQNITTAAPSWFIDDASADLRLRSDAPVRDAAAATATSPADWFGQQRPTSGTDEVGAERLQR